MNKKLIAIDLDGTTLNQDSMITSKTKETLKKQSMPVIMSVLLQDAHSE
ncbi:HAD hydrolase family protein [Enterococcus faecium]|nr:HAD hydrolase family protein [Enterococcus faecium]